MADTMEEQAGQHRGHPGAASADTAIAAVEVLKLRLPYRSAVSFKKIGRAHV